MDDDAKRRIEKERVESQDDRDVIPFEPYRMIARDPLPKQAKIGRDGRPKPKASTEDGDGL